MKRLLQLCCLVFCLATWTIACGPTETIPVETTEETSTVVEVVKEASALQEAPQPEDAGTEPSAPEEPTQNAPEEVVDMQEPTQPELLPEEPTLPEPKPEPIKEVSPPEPRIEAPKPCRSAKDCGKPACASSCQQTIPTCVRGKCGVTKRIVKNAVCEKAAGFCRYKQNICAESYEGILLSTAIYPSEPLSALPSKFKLLKTLQGVGNNGTMMVFASNSPQTICHVVFKGVYLQTPTL